MKQISKEDLQPAGAPGDGWYIIEAAGEHMTHVEDTELVQRLTPEVLAAVAAVGVPAEGLPIDRDHLSLDSDNSTEAMGWVRELAMCGGNLAARIEWTSLGLPLIKGRVYKHFSTVYPPPTVEQLASGTYVPDRLIGLALTNQPNNKTGQPPITNSLGRVGEVRGANYPSSPIGFRLRDEVATPRQDAEAGPSSPIGYAEAGEVQIENSAPAAQDGDNFSEGEVPEESKNKTTEKEPTMYSPELLAVLGLAEGASEEEVLAAAKALKEQAAIANTAAQNAEAAEAEAVINAAEKEHGVTLSDEEKKEAKEQIITNRKHGLKYVGLLCRDKRPVTNTEGRRYAGKAPMVNRSVPTDPELAIANRAQQLCDEARAAGKPLGYFTAVEMARTEAAKNK